MDRNLARLRKICLALPETAETETWGHPNFRVANKIFCAYETYQNELSMCFKVGLALQGVYLKDARFYRTPYVGKHGWVSLKVNAAEIDWKEVEGLVKQSYSLIAPARRRSTPQRP
ncbi:MAG: MmcQ/YjbR family DNA-binding protein [Candidatus Solibacter usitatus]|nr:MmcQ/YjbR family DNA-binding protein [Candidatus Solibacter usitatus]